jgi:hypothetical protein
MKIQTAVDAYGHPILTAAALKRARKHLGWRVGDLVAKTECTVGSTTIYGFEADPTRRLRPLINRKLVDALRNGGIEFVRHASLHADFADNHAA